VHFLNIFINRVGYLKKIWIINASRECQCSLGLLYNNGIENEIVINIMAIHNLLIVIDKEEGQKEVVDLLQWHGALL
jgi:hypothetical protein